VSQAVSRPFLTAEVRISPHVIPYDIFVGQSSTGPVPLAARSSAACLLRLWVRIPPGAWMSVCCECCVLSGRGLCDELITRPEESYQLWSVVECDLATSCMRRPWPTRGCCAKKWHWDRLSPGTSVFPRQHPSARARYSYSSIYMLHLTRRPIGRRVGPFQKAMRFRKSGEGGGAVE